MNTLVIKYMMGGKEIYSITYTGLAIPDHIPMVGDLVQANGMWHKIFERRWYITTLGAELNLHVSQGTND